MEEILSSIKRIIAEEGEESTAAPRRSRGEAMAKPVAELGVPAPTEPYVADVDMRTDADARPDEVLELTDEIIEEEPIPAPKQTRSTPRAAAPENMSILSVESEVAARTSLSALSSMLVAPREGEDNTLDGLVRSMLKPMLKEWLDANLPGMVEEMVAKEIARITAR